MQHDRSHEQPQGNQLEMSLREHLLAEAAPPGPAPPQYPPNVTPANHPYPQTETTPQHNHHNIDPNVTGEAVVPYPIGPDTDDNASPDSRKGKRELSTSKRAAQNRAAQRAFRQRKEGYIKKLEEQVKEFQNMEHNFKALQNENFQLREYILNLQARLLENQSDFPPPPSHINLSATAPPPPTEGGEPSYGPEHQLRREMQQHHPPPPAPVTAREDPIRHDGLSQLQAAAAASGGEAPSPYPTANEYPPPPQQRRLEDGRAPEADAKMTSS